MGISLGGRGGGGGGGTSDIEVLHDADIIDPIPDLYIIPGSKRATTAVNIAALQALTAGVFTVDGVSTAPIDCSGLPDGAAGVTPAVALVTAAIDANPALDGYSVSIFYSSPSFYFIARNHNGNVGTLSGTVVTAMGLNNRITENFVPKSNPLILQPPSSGYWKELRFFAGLELGNVRIPGTFQSTFISDGTDTYSWSTTLSNTGAWWQEVSSNEPTGLYGVGKGVLYNTLYSDFFYNPSTGEITWDSKLLFNPRPGADYKVNSLFVLGIQGS